MANDRQTGKEKTTDGWGVSARNWARGTRPTIGLFTFQVDDTAASQVWSGVVKAAREHDVNVLCFSTQGMIGEWYERSDARDVLFDLASKENLDGLITFHWWSGRQNFERFYKPYSPLPVVNVARLYQGYPGVSWENHEIMHSLVAHLVQTHGYRRIVLLSLPGQQGTPAERYRGYVDALAKYDIPLDPDLVILKSALNGENGIRSLIDERSLRPGIDFQAVIFYNDQMALQAIAALRARGVRVPDEVAVVGIDDLAESSVSVPPLTTVSIPRVEMGYRAVEMLLAALHGSPTSAPVVLSPRLVVRRSCGCLTSAVVQADVPLCLPSGEGSLKAVLSERRADILLAMRQSMGQMAGDRPVDAAPGRAPNAALRIRIEPGWAEHLLDGLVSDISQPKAESAFLTALETGLEQTVIGEGDVKVWQDVLSVLRRQLVPCLDGLVVADGASALPRIESLFQQARVLVAEAIDQAAARRRLRAEQQSQALRTIGQRLVTLFDLDELRDTLVRELPALGIKSAYLVLYQDSVSLDPMPLGIASVGKWAQLMLAYDGSDRGELPPDERRFPVHRLLPDDILPNRAHHFVVEPLFVGEEQLGFLLLDSDQEGYVYEALRGQISSALYGVLLLRQQKLVQIEADQSRQQLERALRDLQATQRRYVEQTWEGYVSSADTVQGYVHADDEQGPTAEAWLPEMTDVVQHGEPVVKKDGSALAVPITLSGEIVGVLGGSGSNRERWSEQEIDAVQAIVEQMALALNSQRLFDQARGRSEELTVLYEMGRSLSAQLDVDQVLDQVYESVSHLIEAANFYVGLYDPDTNQVTFPLDVSNSQVDKAITVMSADEGMTGYVIRSGTSLLIDHDVPGWMRAHDVPVVGELAQCWMGVPLLLGDQVQGVIAVQSYDTPFAYDEDDLNTLTAIASQATTALQNARLFEQARLRSEELLVLNELGQALTARLEVDAVLQEAYQQVSRLMATENFYIGLYDQQTRTIDFVFTVTDSEIDRSIVSVSVDQGLAGYIVRNRTSVLLPDNVRERQEALGITMVGQESASWLGVPMLIGDRVLGVIAVQSYTAAHLYGEHERELLVAVAGPTAIAIQNALLLDEARDRARREQILREISTRLRGSTDPDVIVRAAVRELGLALNRRTFVRLGSVDELSVALSVRQAADGAANHVIEGGE